MRGLLVGNDCRCLVKVHFYERRVGIWESRARTLSNYSSVFRKCSLSNYELYSEPVVVSVFLAYIYCLYNFEVNSMMPENLKTNVPVLYISD